LVADGFGVSSDAGVAGARALVEMLGGVADPRKPRGVRHRIGAVLAVTVFGVLAGARTFREVADRAADLPPVLLAAAGCRLHPATGRYVVPSEPTIRRIAHEIDADAADERVYRWLREQALAAALARGVGGDTGDRGLIGVPMDGKTIRPRRRWRGETVLRDAPRRGDRDRPAGCPGRHERDHPGGRAAQRHRPVRRGGHRRRRARPAHHPAHLTAERGGGYALTVKANQPTLLAQITAALPAAAPSSADRIETDRSKGRIVRRSIWVAPATGVEFPGAAQVFRIRRDTFDKAIGCPKRSCTASPA
jgi:hypothetical protein